MSGQEREALTGLMKALVTYRDRQNPTNSPNDGWDQVMAAYAVGRAALAAREEPQNDQLQVVVDFLDAWRYCPVMSADSPSRECLEKAAREILTALADAREDAYNYRGMA